MDLDPDPNLDADPDRAFYSSLTFKILTKNKFFKKSSAYYFLKVHLHYYSKKKVTKQLESRFFLLFLLGDIRIQIQIQTS